VSKFKRLRGKFDFRGGQAGDPSDIERQFVQLYTSLSGSFSGRTLLATPAPKGNEPPKADGARTAADSKQDDSLLFPVVLTFAEREGHSEMAKLEKVLRDFFRRIVEAAKNLPGPIGAAAGVIDAVDELLSKDPAAPAAVELKRIAHDEPAATAWPKVTKLLKRWGDADLARLQKAPLNDANWQEILDRLRKHDPNAVTGPLPPAPAVPPAPSVPAVPPAPPAPPAPAVPPAPPAPSAPVDPAVPPKAPEFELTQLTGWMSKRDDIFAFSVEGRTRFPDEAVQYGTWARLDVLGPDGSQLLTSYVSRDELGNWLFDDGGDVGDVSVTPTVELRRALANPPPHQKQTASVHGRLWFDDGRTFGSRTVAVFVPPSFSRVMSACVAPFEEHSSNDDVRAVLVAPQALAVTHTDENGYFEFSYPADAAIDQNHALLHISGLSAPVAVTLTETTLPPSDAHGQKRSQKRFARPVLVQVNANLIAKEVADTVDWLDEDADGEEDDCGCGGVDFNQPNRSVDEFNFDIVVRTTDPSVVRTTVHDVDRAAKAQGDAADVPPEEAPINDYFRTTLSRTERIRWDENPKAAQAVTISHGRVLTLSQTWHTDGYSLGDLRYSLPLAPLQKKNIAIVDWDRRDLLRLDSDQEYRESMYNYVGRERDISEIVNSALNETVKGRSDSGSSASSAGGGFGFGGIIFGGASGGSSSAWSSSEQNSNRTLAANFINRLRDQTVQSANALRSNRVTTVQQVDQSERTRAVTETVANRNACHAITVQYFEVLRHFRVEHELIGVRECLFVPLPLSAFDERKALRWRDSLVAYLPTPELRNGLDAIDRQQEQDYPATYAKELLLSLGADMRVRIDLPLPAAELKAETDWKAWLGVDLSAPSPLPSLIDKLKQAEANKRAEFWETNIAPVLATKLIAEWKFVTKVGGLDQTLPLEASLAEGYRAGEEHRVLVRAQQDVKGAQLIREELQTLILQSPATSGTLSVTLTGAQFYVGTEHLSTTVPAGREVSGLVNGTPLVLLLPLRPQELRSPDKEDKRKVRRLIAHLNDNLEFYHKAIWWTMDPDRRYTLLDGYVAPNSGGRSVASVVENRLIAITGNSLVLPVAPGIRLDYFVDGRMTEGGEDGLLAYYRPTISPRPTRIAVPTKGVFAEAVMGNCNACEKIDNSRNWQYWEHKLPDEPTTIDPVSLATRAKDTPVATPPPMPGTPIINQVATSVPTAPEPTGLAAVLTALVKSGVFPDAAGLPGTQQNAGAGLNTTFATTQRFGELGAELSKKQLQASMDAMKMIFSAYTGIPIPLGGDNDTPSSPAGVRDTIKKDAKSGRISKEQAQTALDRLNNAMIDGVSPKASNDLLDHPELSSAIGNAGERGTPLSVSRGDTKIDIGESAGASERPGERGGSWWSRLLRPERAEAAPPSRMRAVGKRGLFLGLATAFPRKDEYDHDAFFRLLGGEWPTKKGDDYANTCALRLSYALNGAGIAIPRGHRQFIDGKGRPLIGSVGAMEKALIALFGRPPVDVVKESGTELPRYPVQGIICMRGGLTGATGHVDLWDGRHFSGGGEWDWVTASHYVKFWRLN
jgi:hypothetical protein